jgi:hypothetical protein
MWKKLIITILFGFLLGAAPQRVRPVSEIPYYPTPPEKYGKPGWEERGPEFRRWLAPSVMVTRNPSGGGGSGTICHYDASEGWAYIISCGHLYASGYKSAESYKNSSKHYKKITVFYHNEKKLEKPKTYKAETLCHVWDGIYDVSLLRFKPDWVPWVNRIAPVDYKLEKGKFYHSCGCDGLRPVAHYSVKYYSERFHNRKYGRVSDVITTNNNPRGGRSGGGVFTDDHQLLMICSRAGGGYGYWSSLQQIHKFLTKEGFEFVLKGRSLANQIPVIDRNNPQGDYDKDYIPTPKQPAKREDTD